MENIELEISIDAQGRTEVHIKGIKGPGCEDLAKVLGEIVGRIDEQRHTQEYYEPPDPVRIDLNARSR